MLVVKPRAAVAWCLAAFTAYTVRVCYTDVCMQSVR